MARTVPIRVVEVHAESGFDWGDAAIGAVAVVALAVIAYGLGVTKRSLLSCVLTVAVALLAAIR